MPIKRAEALIKACQDHVELFLRVMNGIDATEHPPMLSQKHKGALGIARITPDGRTTRDAVYME